MATNKDRILIKLSGASFKNKGDSSPFNFEKIRMFCQQIIEINKKYQVGLVIGGGNIWRGNMSKTMNSYHADCIGMLSTVMNAIAIHDTFQSLGAKTRIYSAASIPKIAHDLNDQDIQDDLNQNKIVIFSGGVGHPYFTTDTCCVIRAFDIQAGFILIGKNGTDGVYDLDPNKDRHAKFLSHLTFQEAIEQKLQVMDLTAMALCRDKKIKIIVFDIDKENSIIDVLNKKGKYSMIDNEEK